jgi:predicted enzyme related to lactoylglutathione lyase
MVQRIEIGLISASRALADFYAEVFNLEALPEMEAGPGVIHRLQGPGTMIKVMVPSKPPGVLEPVVPFFTKTGLRYLTIFVDDLDALLERAAARNGKVAHPPMDIGPGVRIAVIADPDGNPIELVEGAP